MAKISIKREQTKIPEPLREEELERLVALLPSYAQPIAIVAAYAGLRREELFSLEWRDVDLQHKLLRVRVSKNDDFRIVPLLNEAYQALSELKAALASEKVRTLQVFPAHLHVLRHTCATRLLSRGIPLDQIQKRLGHKSIVTTQCYAKTRPETLKEAAAALE